MDESNPKTTKRTVEDRSPASNSLLRSDQPTIGQAVETFLRLELLGRSEQTVHWYRDRLNKLVDYLGEDRLLVTVMDVDLLEWIAAMSVKKTKYGGDSTRPVEKGKLSAFTLKGYVRATRRFFRWLYLKKLIEFNPAEELPFPKTPKTSRKGISERDMKAILEVAKENVRDYAIIQFIRATGGRLGGVVNLKLSDLNLDAEDQRLRLRVTIREKGNKERTVFLTKAALAALEEWVSIRPDCDDENVFIGASIGQPWHALKERGIYTVMEKYAKKAKVKGPWSPHQWRHRFARKLLQEGLDLARLSQIMGHTTSQITVEYYGQFVVDQLQQGYDQFMPDEK